LIRSSRHAAAPWRPQHQPGSEPGHPAGRPGATFRQPEGPRGPAQAREHTGRFWRFAVVAAAVLAPAVAGCEAGTNAPTQEWHQPTPGASAQVGTAIRVNNMFVLGAPPGAQLPRGSSAGVFLALYNAGSPDRLVSITAPGTATAVRLPGGSVRLGHNQSVLLTGPRPQVVLEHLTRPLAGGQAIRMVLNFANAGQVPLEVPVMPRAQYYSTYSPVPPSPSATAGHRGHRKKTGAVPAPTGSPSP
jgi:copper(I)-binding protein